MANVISPEGPSKAKKQRRKHKNSKLGCLQCKERRMKCNEEFPECRNCRIRQVKIPCSYLSFTEDEKKEFLALKAKLLSTPVNSVSSPSLTFPSPASSSPYDGEKQPVKFRLIKHTQLLILESQTVNFGETPSSYHGRLFFTKMINGSFAEPHAAFSSHFTMTGVWLSMQMRKRLEAFDKHDKEFERRIQDLEKVATRHKSTTIALVRKCVLAIMAAQGKSDPRKFAELYGMMTLPTLCLQASDMWTQTSIRGYYMTGSLIALTELYEKVSDSSPIAQFTASTFAATHGSLFIPNYKCGILDEIFEVLNDLGEIINKTEDHLLIFHYEQLLDFLEDDVSVELLESNFDPKSITAYPAKLIYSIYHRFNEIMPSEIFTIDSASSSALKILSCFFYAIARVLDNIFPEARFILRFRFIGPTTIYPFTSEALLDGLNSEETYYANYALRMHAFFSKRSDLFTKYMKVRNMFPDSLAQNRFKSRKVKVKEEFLTSLRDNFIQPRHYPQVLSPGLDKQVQSPSSQSSQSSQSSFSLHFDTSYPLSFEFENTLNIRPEQTKSQTSDTLEEKPVFCSTLPSGLLAQDYDPFSEDIQEHHLKEPTKVSLSKCVNDYRDIMNKFTTE